MNLVFAPEGDVFAWDKNSTYIQEPSFFEGLTPEPLPVESIQNARVLVVAPDTTTTDHITPAGSIATDSPAAQYLRDKGVETKVFNTYGSRRGNHEVMMRGTFANVRFRNQLTPDTEGTSTIYFPTREQMSIYDAAMKYKRDKTPLVVFAGKDYGMGSSRDWAAKGQYLLGVRAVIFESIERIHRSNLIGMGILPLQFKDGDTFASLELHGDEIFEIVLNSRDSQNLHPKQILQVVAKRDSNEQFFEVVCRLDSPVEVEYYKNGGILQYVLRKLM